jgi:hypothetical protein
MSAKARAPRSPARIGRISGRPSLHYSTATALCGEEHDMKTRKPRTPDPQPDPPPSLKDAPRWDDGPNPHFKSDYRRYIFRDWAPKTAVEAHAILEESMSKAQALSSIIADYAADADRVSLTDLRYSLEVLEDFLYVGYSMIELWQPSDDQADDEEGDA